MTGCSWAKSATQALAVRVGRPMPLVEVRGAEGAEGRLDAEGEVLPARPALGSPELEGVDADAGRRRLGGGLGDGLVAGVADGEHAGEALVAEVDGDVVVCACRQTKA